MSKELCPAGAIQLTDQANVVPVYNYSATKIATGSALIVDATNIDPDQAVLAVATTTSADSKARCGFAVGAIPGATTDGQGITTPGIGQMAVAGSIVRGLSASTAFTVGQQVGTTATAGYVAVSTTQAALLGNIILAETTTTPLILVSMS